jgi:DNA polymerase I
MVLSAMETEGITLDISLVSILEERVDKDLAIIVQQISDLIPGGTQSINLNSSRQIEQLLFTILGLPPQGKKAKSGFHSTDVDALQKLAKIHPVPALIIQYRELTKLKTTYIRALPTYINPITKRIHTNYSQITTATGRLASTKPNMQNIPTSKIGKELRAAFVPPHGQCFIAADYTQIELRILACLSKDSKLIDVFLANRDIHVETASLLWNTPPEHVTHEQRQLGKRINFSILYGQTPYGLAQELSIPHADAKKYIETYFDEYKGVTQWMNAIIAGAKQDGFVRTYFGRKRSIPNIHQKNQTLFAEARRVAINTVIQGTAADVMKKGMIQLHTCFAENVPETKLILQIHDELIISTPHHCREQAQNITKHVLESVVDWAVPLTVSLSHGANWKEVSK